MEELKGLISKKKRQSMFRRPLEIYELFGEWNKQAGKIFGGKSIRCKPQVLRGKTLIVEVEGASAASELQMRQFQLVEKINKHFSREIVERIIFKLSR